MRLVGCAARYRCGVLVGSVQPVNTGNAPFCSRSMLQVGFGGPRHALTRGEMRSPLQK